MTLMQNRTRALGRRLLASNNLNREKCMLFVFSRYIVLTGGRYASIGAYLKMSRWYNWVFHRGSIGVFEEYNDRFHGM